MTLRPSASAARTSARLVSDFEPGSATTAESGPAPRGAGHGSCFDGVTGHMVAGWPAPVSSAGMNACLGALGAALLLAGCSGQQPPAPVAVPTPTVTATATSEACPVPAPKPFRWPAPVPADLPQPPGAVLEGKDTDGGITLVRFSTPTSLRQGVLFVIGEVQKAGFTLGRGDAEPAEADVPFGRGELRGIYKLRAQAPCATLWLVAVAQATASQPFLTPPSPGPSSSPLPFG